LSNCAANSNTAAVAISASAGCALTNCSASSNTATYGINASNGSSLTNCSASFNTGTGSGSGGINAGSGSTLTYCTAYSNGTTAGSPNSSTGIGFNLSTGCTIQNCTAQSNRGDGIKALNDCVVRENNCGLNSNGAGIRTVGNNNRIAGNHVIGNSRGISVDTSGSLIINNSASSNSIDYVIFANNRYGPIVDISAFGAPAVSGKSAPDTTATSHPWANFSY